MYKYFVYWIHDSSHNDIFSQGYIGVTNNINGRIRAHRGSKINYYVKTALKNQAIVTVIYQGEAESCYELERSLRPTPKIGWNILCGGYRVDYKEYKRMGRKPSENPVYRKPEQYKSSKKTWKVNKPDGSSEIITGLRSFCKEHNLHYTCMRDITAGRQKTHRGYTLERI